MVGRFSIEVNGVEAESFFVGDRNSSDHRSNEYMAAMQLNNAYAVTTVRAISILEPDFGGANAQKTLTFIGWETDGRYEYIREPFGEGDFTVVCVVAVVLVAAVVVVVRGRGGQNP